MQYSDYQRLNFSQPVGHYDHDLRDQIALHHQNMNLRYYSHVPQIQTPTHLYPVHHTQFAQMIQPQPQMPQMIAQNYHTQYNHNSSIRRRGRQVTSPPPPPPPPPPLMPARTAMRRRLYVSPTQVSAPTSASKHQQQKQARKQPIKVHRNDYSQNYVNTNQRPQNYIRSASPTSRFAEHPKLRTLIELKDSLFAARATPPMHITCPDIRELQLAPALGCNKFDVIYLSPPLLSGPGAPGVTPWSWDEISRLAITSVASSPGFIFLWAGDGGEDLERGREILTKWGYRRAEDIVWVKTNKAGVDDFVDDEGTGIFRRHKEHCLVGIRGTLRRSKDTHFIHCNVDTDVIVAEASAHKPDEMYQIIERFCLGRRRLRLFGDATDAMRPGWVTVLQGSESSDDGGIGASSSLSSFEPNVYRSWFEGPNAGVVGFDSRIEALRPKSPVH